MRLQDMKNISIAEDFSQFPGPRFVTLGPYSGELFRKEILIPAIEDVGGEIAISLDGTMGYGSSFLEESFGGLIRADIDASIVNSIVSNLISDEDPSLIDEIKDYVQDELDKK